MIPTIIVDNFFKQPEDVLDFANSLDYSVSGNNYPGKRTNCISTINLEFYKHFAEKVFFNYPFHVLSYDLDLTFQKIKEKYDTGLVHTDPSEITVIVYLNKGSSIDSNCGTGIYLPKQKDGSVLVLDHNDIKESDKQLVLEHNSQFSKVIDSNNIFNRALIFDGRIPHCANSYKTEEDRFILVGFFKNLVLEPIKNKNILNLL